MINAAVSKSKINLKKARLRGCKFNQGNIVEFPLKRRRLQSSHASSICTSTKAQKRNQNKKNKGKSIRQLVNAYLVGRKKDHIVVYVCFNHTGCTFLWFCNLQYFHYSFRRFAEEITDKTCIQITDLILKKLPNIRKRSVLKTAQRINHILHQDLTGNSDLIHQYLSNWPVEVCKTIAEYLIVKNSNTTCDSLANCSPKAWTQHHFYHFFRLFYIGDCFSICDFVCDAQLDGEMLFQKCFNERAFFKSFYNEQITVLLRNLRRLQAAIQADLNV